MEGINANQFHLMEITDKKIQGLGAHLERMVDFIRDPAGRKERGTCMINSRVTHSH